MGPYLHGKPERDRKRKELLEAYKVPELQPEWERKTLRSGHQSRTSETSGFWPGRLSATTSMAGRNPSSSCRTPHAKQQDQLTDHFIKWYGLVDAAQAQQGAEVQGTRRQAAAAGE